MSSPSHEETPDSKHEQSIPPPGGSLTDALRAQVERNRQRALLIRQKRQQAKSDQVTIPKKKVKAAEPIDTGGGFLLDLEEEATADQAKKIIHAPGALLSLNNEEELICEECGREFLESFLYDSFRLSVCDGCRDIDGKHKLITRSTAKEVYLLKDVDFDKREPPLSFIEKKNPHNDRWGKMKLYLELQVRSRSREIWGEEEKLDEERERRIEAREKAKQKSYDKKVKDLRMAVRSSLWRKDVGAHEHEYGEETYNQETDEYCQTCKTCGHVNTYEKM